MKQITWRTNSAYLLNMNIFKHEPKILEFVKMKHDEAWKDKSKICHDVEIIIRFRKRVMKQAKERRR